MTSIALYKALRSANVSEAEAEAAANDVATDEARFAKIEAELTILKWMVGTVIALPFAGFGILARMISA